MCAHEKIDVIQDVKKAGLEGALCLDQGSPAIAVSNIFLRSSETDVSCPVWSPIARNVKPESRRREPITLFSIKSMKLVSPLILLNNVMSII